MNNTTSAFCPLHVNFGFAGEIVMISFLSSTALLGNALCLRVIRMSGGALPVNVKTWLSNYGLAFTIRSLYFVSKSLYYTIIAVASATATADLSMNRLSCIIHESFNLTTICVAHFSLMLVSFDRLWATLHKNKIKVEDRNIGASLIWVSIIWIVFSLAFFFIAFHSNTAHQLFEKLCYCHNVMIWTLEATVYVSIYTISVQVVTFMTNFYVYKKNSQLIEQFTLKSDQHNLNERFVMWSNINTTRWLIPINVFHCTISVALILSINIGRLVYHSISDGYIIYITAFMNVYALEIMVHPLATIRLNSVLMKITHQLYPKMIDIPVINRCFYDQEMINSQKLISVENNQLANQNVNLALSTLTNINPLIKMDQTKKVKSYLMRKNYVEPQQKSIMTTNMIKIHGRKTIVEYRLKPDQQNDLLSEMWTMASKK